ncbi:MAG: alcohol dehydrogenase catalytic domain-containing protein [Firmicutes bacterium]|nr:alcohol dehydrogenase catalytic domain-containing protein [Bacillota bacterium]
MKAAVLMAPHDIQIVERPEPKTVPPGYVRIRVKAVGICGSEIHYYESGRIGEHILSRPMVIGHEIGGLVEEVGEGVDTTFQRGTVVSLEPGVPCGQCSFCRQGEYNFCPQMQFFATPPVDGAMQDVIVHPAAYTFPADPLSVEEAALAEPLAVGVYAARQLNIQAGDSVLVVGGGPVGLLSALAAESQGAMVTVAEINNARRKLGQQMGFSVVLPEELSVGDGYDHVLECSGSQGGLGLAFGRVKTHGQIAVIGLGDTREMQINALTIALRGLRVYGIYRYKNAFPTAVRILAIHRERLKPLLAHKITLHDVPEFFRQKRYAEALKTLVTL